MAWLACGMHAFVLFLSRRENLLELDNRRQIYECLQAFPGLHLREIARQVDMDPNHAKYHLQYLEKHGLASSQEDDGYWRFWPKEDGAAGARDVLGREDKEALAFLRRPVPFRVIWILLNEETLSQQALLEHVDVSQSTLHYHLSKMESAGIISSRKPTRERLYQLDDADRMLGLVMTYKPPKGMVKGFLEAWDDLELDRKKSTKLQEKKKGKKVARAD